MLHHRGHGSTHIAFAEALQQIADGKFKTISWQSASSSMSDSLLRRFVIEAAAAGHNVDVVNATRLVRFPCGATVEFASPRPLLGSSFPQEFALGFDGGG